MKAGRCDLASSPGLLDLEDNTIRPFVANLAPYASIASLPSLVVTYIAWIQKPGIGRTVILCFAAPVAIAAYTLDVSDRLGLIKLSEGGELVELGKTPRIVVRSSKFPTVTEL